ncbi:hypothetical protein [Plebeiibacterium marinum]|uniref:Lipoprotein n=1 Tax=Plebeiibacterium marinum TaxID=2992111 RepID=A0AAE3MHJ0_9BACT|nr:hypothetical protein [Plebeiobacterium marinum]MCW3808098.1 hypothetical protein [Plebeiobacterium marinum]
MKFLISILLLFIILTSCSNEEVLENSIWVNTHCLDNECPIVLNFINDKALEFSYLTDSTVKYNYKINDNILYLDKKGIIENKYKISRSFQDLVLASEQDTLRLKVLKPTNYTAKIKLDNILGSTNYHWNCTGLSKKDMSIHIQFMETGKCIVEYDSDNLDTSIYELKKWSIISKDLNGSTYCFLNIQSHESISFLLTDVLNDKITGVYLSGSQFNDEVCLLKEENENHEDLSGKWSIINKKSLEREKYFYKIPDVIYFSSFSTLNMEEDVYKFEYEDLPRQGDNFRFGNYVRVFSGRLVILDYLINDDYGDFIQILEDGNDKISLGLFMERSNCPLFIQYERY